jgi:hypothetical protein
LIVEIVTVGAPVFAAVTVTAAAPRTCEFAVAAAMIVAVPAFSAVTTPVAAPTDATVASLDDHATVRTV